MADEPEDVVADMQAGTPDTPDPEVVEQALAEAGDETVDEGVESPEAEAPEEPEPEPLIEVSALDVPATMAMASALEAFKFFNHSIGRAAMGAVVREVVVEIHGQPWCRLVVNTNGVPQVEPLVQVLRPAPTEEPT